ncbi:hypothetical protein H4R22_001040 [Coemansia sp. RSA 1290]|nr:hypothetical protein H4R22_001040 [Coemansia sp. RSA 1290]KAJ2647427.1 hypothetical protein IWW40_004697 [Coemansia sp. RSA 1250]
MFKALGLMLLGASAMAHRYSTNNDKPIENEYHQLAVHHHVRASNPGYNKHHSAKDSGNAHVASVPPRHIAWPQAPQAAHPTDINAAISDVLMHSGMVVADEAFSTMLLSAIEANHGNMPVISI